MRILALLGTFQYDVANGFVRDLAAALAQLPGNYVEVVSPNNDLELWMAMKACQPDMVLSMQAICCDRSTALKFPATAWILIAIDHPSYSYHTRYSQIQAPRSLITSYEPSHLVYLKHALPHIPRALLPHPAPTDIPQAREPDFGLSFLGSWHDPNQHLQELKGRVSKATYKRIQVALEYAQHQRCSDVMQLMPFNESLWKNNIGEWSYAVSQVDYVIRLTLRKRLLQELDQTGIGIEIFGTGWNTADWKCHRIHAPVDYHTALTISAGSQGILSITPCHANGSHERVLSCLAQGSICITSPSSFYDDAGFVAGRDYLSYDPWEVGSLSAAVAKLPTLKNSEERQAALPHTQARIQRDHSALARAQRIMQLMQEHFGLN